MQLNHFNININKRQGKVYPYYRYISSLERFDLIQMDMFYNIVHVRYIFHRDQYSCERNYKQEIQLSLPDHLNVRYKKDLLVVCLLLMRVHNSGVDQIFYFL